MDCCTSRTHCLEEQLGPPITGVGGTAVGIKMMIIYKSKDFFLNSIHLHIHLFFSFLAMYNNFLHYSLRNKKYFSSTNFLFHIFECNQHRLSLPFKQIFFVVVVVIFAADNKTKSWYEMNNNH